MAVPPGGDGVGYCRPPKETQWTTGHSGNPKRARQTTAKPAVELIDDFFAAQTNVVEGGVRKRISNFKAILLQLATKATTGNKRALNVFLKYHEFAAGRGEKGQGPIFVLMPTNPENLGDQNG